MSDVILAGWCDGGPWAGERLAGHSARIAVALLRDPVMPAAFGIQSRAVVSPPKVEYGHYEFDEGAWRWKGPPP